MDTGCIDMGWHARRQGISCSFLCQRSGADKNLGTGWYQSCRRPKYVIFDWEPEQLRRWEFVQREDGVYGGVQGPHTHAHRTQSARRSIADSLEMVHTFNPEVSYARVVSSSQSSNNRQPRQRETMNCKSTRRSNWAVASADKLEQAIHSLVLIRAILLALFLLVCLP